MRPILLPEPQHAALNAEQKPRGVSAECPWLRLDPEVVRRKRSRGPAAPERHYRHAYPAGLLPPGEADRLSRPGVNDPFPVLPPLRGREHDLLDRLLHIERALEPLVHVLLERLFYDCRGLPAYLRVQLPYVGEDQGAFRRIPAGHAVVQRGAERKDVRAHVGLADAVLLRRGISRRSVHKRVLALVLLEEPCNAEVDKFYPAVLADHDVRGLEVPKNDGLRLLHAQKMHGPADLKRPGQRQSLVQGISAPGFQDMVEGFSVDVLHNDEMNALEREIIIDLWKVRVREPQEDPRFGPELGQRFHGLLKRERARPELLDSQDRASLLTVRDLVHASHSAPAEDLDDLVSFFEKTFHGDLMHQPKKDVGRR